MENSNKEKQIEEMAQVIDASIERYYKIGYEADGDTIAPDLYAEGYRKQTEGELDSIIEQIIRKKAEVSEYWQNDVNQYRAMKGYSDIEHDVDNFLRGYNEAVEDVLAILDGAKMKGGE